jgi:glycosyltransferase involved in cell wall biosynthesis
MTLPCADHGVGMTCRSILRGAIEHGVKADLFTSRSDSTVKEPFPLYQFTPSALQDLPFSFSRPLSVRTLHKTYLKALDDNELAYLWPAVPVWIYEELHKRGVRILTEAINTRMADAKRILDAAYEQVGLPAAHGITDARIATEELRHSLCTAIFSPSPATDQSLIHSEARIPFIPVSYGTNVSALQAIEPRRSGSGATNFLFLGASTVRKGLHQLLEVWRDMPTTARLRIVGLDDEAFEERYADVLSQDNVSAAGFTNDVDREYAQADVFVLPSLEEGDPIVTYEAAARGLPVVASAVGAGRIGAETGAIVSLDTANIDLFRARLLEFANSEELRRHWGKRAREASLAYDWRPATLRRFTALADFLTTRA